MLSQPVEDGLNDQIQCEMQAAYLYLAMSAHFESEGLPGCAHWMKLQAQEELSHAMRIYQYVLDRGGRIRLKAVDAPPPSFGPPVEVFQAALAHEQKVTGRINALHALAVKETDPATQSHLQWFIDEQVEEEKSATDVRDLFQRAGTHEAAVLMIDQSLGQRAAAE